MADYASVNGVRIVSGRLTIPYWGLWTCDAHLATDADIDTKVTLTIGNLTLSGYSFRSTGFAGVRTARLVGGTGGWNDVVPPKQYADPGGVLLSMVLGDVAKEVGETISIASDRVIGTGYARELAPASRVLRQLVGAQWWIDAAGVTHTGPRPAPTITTDFLINESEGGKGRFTISTEDPAAWQPGASFSNALSPTPSTISSVSIEMEPKGQHRLTVLVPMPDRLMQSLREIVRAEFPQLTYAGVWEYSVSSATSSTFDGHATSSACPLPSLVGISSRPGIAGATFTPAAGSLVLVAFANADPTRPVVVSWDGTTPDGLSFDASSTVQLADALAPPVRYGETVTIGVASGPVVFTAPGAPAAPVLGQSRVVL